MALSKNVVYTKLAQFDDSQKSTKVPVRAYILVFYYASQFKGQSKEKSLKKAFWNDCK